jgi:hypothetical protein
MRVGSWHDDCFLLVARDARVPLEGFRKGDGMNTGRMTLIGIGLALYLLGFGMLAGATVERMRFDHKRSQILARYDEALQRVARLPDRAGENRRPALRTLDIAFRRQR